MLLSLAQGDGRRSLYAVLGKRVRAYTKSEKKSLGGGAEQESANDSLRSERVP